MKISEETKKTFISIFKREAVRLLKQQNHKDLDDNIKFIEKVLDRKVYLSGELFYKIVDKFNFDITVLSDKIFATLKTTTVKPSNLASTKLQKVFYPIMLQQKDFEIATGLGKSRISRIFSPKNKDKKTKKEDVQAHEVYVLAKSRDISIKQLFDYLYGDGEKPTITV